MRRPSLVKRSGPYKCVSISQDGKEVRIVIYPAFPDYNTENFKWVDHRYKEEGGGPSIFTAMALASDLQEFLNAPYSDADVANWLDKCPSIKITQKRKRKNPREFLDDPVYKNM